MDVCMALLYGVWHLCQERRPCPDPYATALAVLMCLSPATFAHSYSHISGNDWVITCNDGTEINITGSEADVHNSVRSSCRGHVAAPVGGLVGVADAAAPVTGVGATPRPNKTNHNSVRSSKTQAASQPDEAPAPAKLEQKPR